MADGLKRIKLSEDYAGQKSGTIYVCDPVRAQWLVDNDHGREATAADLSPKPSRAVDADEPPRPRRRRGSRK